MFAFHFGLPPPEVHTPPELVMAHLNIDQATYDKIPKEKQVVVAR